MFSFNAGWYANVNAWPYSHNAEGIHNCILQGPGANGGSGAGSSVAIETSGTNGGLGQGGSITGNSVAGFSVAIDDGNNVSCDPSGQKTSYLWVARDNQLEGNTIGIALCGTIEKLTFDHNIIAGGTQGIVCAGVSPPSGGGIDFSVDSGSMDTLTTNSIQASFCSFDVTHVHFETNLAGSPNFIVLTENSQVNVYGGRMVNDTKANTTEFITDSAQYGTSSLAVRGVAISTPQSKSQNFAKLTLVGVGALNTVFDFYKGFSPVNAYYNADYTGCVTLSGESGNQICGALTLYNGGAGAPVNIIPFNTAPSGACPSAASLGVNAAAKTNSTVLYVCPAGTSTWMAVAVQ
jgi:hypothetical protein